MMNSRYLWMPIALLLSMPAMAQEEAEGPTSPWSGKAALGFLATSGNTENTSLNAAFDVGYATGKWAHALEILAINNSTDKDPTAESYRAGWSTKYAFSERSYAFGRLDWLSDRFAGYTTQFSQTAGYGRRVFDTEAHRLNLEIGAGAKQLEIDSGATENELIVRGGLDYVWNFSKNAEFGQSLVVEAGDTNTFTESITSLTATLVGELGLVASYTIRNNSDVPVGSEKTDTFSALSLKYSF